MADRATLNINVTTTPEEPVLLPLLPSLKKDKGTHPSPASYSEGRWGADGKTWTGPKGTGGPDQSAFAPGGDQESFFGAMARTYILFPIHAILSRPQKACAVFFACSFSVGEIDAVVQSIAALHAKDFVAPLLMVATLVLVFMDCLRAAVEPIEKAPHQCPGRFQFFVKVNGKTITINAHTSDTIATIKHRVKDKEAIPPAKLRLQFHGKDLDNEKSVGNYKIIRESTIHGCLRGRGGMKRPSRVTNGYQVEGGDLTCHGLKENNYCRSKFENDASYISSYDGHQVCQDCYDTLLQPASNGYRPVTTKEKRRMEGKGTRKTSATTLSFLPLP